VASGNRQLTTGQPSNGTSIAIVVIVTFAIYDIAENSF
jgi:hypothetical protein